MFRWLWWSLVAFVVSLFMRSGKRYTLEDYRWRLLRGAIIERDKHCCRRCGDRAQYGRVWLEVHHKHRVADGGSYRPWNLVTLCDRCHRTTYVKA